MPILEFQKDSYRQIKAHYLVHIIQQQKNCFLFEIISGSLQTNF